METDDSPSLVHVLARRAEAHPDRRAYTFVEGERELGAVTYGDLARKAWGLAALLGDAAAAGERALLLYEPGLDYLVAFYACLYAGLVAVPAYPPEPLRADRGLGRLRAIAGDARPALVLTSPALRPAVEELIAAAPELAGARLCTTDGALPADAWRAPLPAASRTAFLQYTSGSTASPRGVVLTHANLMANQRMIRAAFGHDEATVVASWLPLYHDMGLIGNMLQPVFVGGACVVMSPLAFVKHPLRWLRLVSRYRATTSGAPNFAYELCLRRVPDDALPELDLGSWRVAYCGAEPIRADTLARFAARFAPCGLRPEALYPCFGLAEATLLVSGGATAAAPVVRRFDREALRDGRVQPSAAGDGVALVGCGQAPAGEEILIVDPDRATPAPPGHLGEIWVAGPHVASGYWNRAEESAATFAGRLAGSGAGPYLRTGDLGFFADGELYIAGRCKDLIILAGRNHFPQDIEQTVEASHTAFRRDGCAAFALEAAGEERLGVAVELDALRGEQADGPQLCAAVRRVVADAHGIAAHTIALVRRGGIPRTSSGKLRRRACADALASGALDVLHLERERGPG